MLLSGVMLGEREIYHNIVVKGINPRLVRAYT